MEEQPESQPADVYRRRADLFVEVMRSIAPELLLDFSPESIADLEGFVAGAFDPPGSVDVGPNLPVDLGCYVGEAIRRAVGGTWSQQTPGQLDAVGEIAALWPIQKSARRFQLGAAESLAAYAGRVLEHSAGGAQAAA